MMPKCYSGDSQWASPIQTSRSEFLCDTWQKQYARILFPDGKLLEVSGDIVASHAAAELAIRNKTNQLGEENFAFDPPSILVYWAECRHISQIAASKMRQSRLSGYKSNRISWL
jgi:hypothetical protein